MTMQVTVTLDATSSVIRQLEKLIQDQQNELEQLREQNKTLLQHMDRRDQIIDKLLSNPGASDKLPDEAAHVLRTGTNGLPVSVSVLDASAEGIPPIEVYEDDVW